MTEKAMGIFSAEAANLYGTTIWRGVDGKEYEITARDIPSKYNWPDKVILAEVEEYIRKGKPATIDLEFEIERGNWELILMKRRTPMTYKRRGGLYFLRIGRLSLSFTWRKQ